MFLYLFTFPRSRQEVDGSVAVLLVGGEELRKHLVHGATHAVCLVAFLLLVAVREIEVPYQWIVDQTL